MRVSSRAAGILAGCVMAAGASRIAAQEWAQWRGPRRDGTVSGFTAPQAWPKRLTQKWKTTVGSGDATPAFVGGKLYVFARQGASEITLCLDGDTGKELWKEAVATQAVTGPAGSHPGPRSSPVVAEGKVVTLGVAGVVSCLDAATGKEAWRKNDFPGKWPAFFAASSPAIVDGLCVAQVGGGGGGAIVAYDLATGARKWTWEGEGPGYASPVLLTAGGTKMVVGLTEKSVVGVGAADGKLLWQIPFGPQGMTSNSITPIVDGSTVIYSGRYRGIHAVKVEKQAGGFAAKELWNNAQLGSQFSTPVLKDGLIFGLSDRGNLFCVDAASGSTAWSDATRHGDFGAILDAGSVILALTSKSELIAFRPERQAYAELARIRVADKETYAHPVIAGKRIYVRDQDSVALLEF